MLGADEIIAVVVAIVAVVHVVQEAVAVLNPL